MYKTIFYASWFSEDEIHSLNKKTKHEIQKKKLKSYNKQKLSLQSKDLKQLLRQIQFFRDILIKSTIMKSGNEPSIAACNSQIQTQIGMKHLCVANNYEEIIEIQDYFSGNKGSQQINPDNLVEFVKHDLQKSFRFQQDSQQTYSDSVKQDNEKHFKVQAPQEDSPKKLISKSSLFNKYKQFYEDLMNEQKVKKVYFDSGYNHKGKQNINFDINVWTKMILENNYSKLQNNGIFIGKSLVKNPIFEIIESSLHARILKLKFHFSYFIFELNIINFPNKFLHYQKKFLKLESGSYGTIYRMFDQIKNKFIALKLIQVLKNDSTKNQNNLYVIQPVLIEYCISKLFSVLEFGLPIPNSLGFDLICFSDSAMFQMELGKPYTQLNQQEIKKVQGVFQKDLAQSLFFLHSVHIIHQDIKPSNVLFCPSLNKMVLIDFGISQLIKQKIGEKTQSTFVGTYEFCSSEMKKLFYEQKPHQIDLYWNDVHSLKCTTNLIKDKFVFLLKYDVSSKQNHIMKAYFSNDKSQQIDKCIDQFQYVGFRFEHQYFQKLKSAELTKDQATKSFQVDEMVRLIYGLYVQDKIKVENVLGKIKIQKLSKQTVNMIAEYMRELFPTFKLYEIFNQTIKSIFNFFAYFQLNQAISELLYVYKNVQNFNVLYFSYDKKLESLFLSRLGLNNQTDLLTQKKKPALIMGKIIQEPTNGNKFLWYMNFLEMLEKTDFYEQELNYLKSTDIHNTIFHFGNKYFNINRDKAVFEVLKEILQNIWNSTKAYLDQYYRVSQQPKTSMVNVQSQEFVYTRFLKTQEQKKQRYKRFEQQKQHQFGLQIYPMDFIVQLMPEIMYKVIQIQKRLEIDECYINHLYDYCIYANSRNKLILSFYDIAKNAQKLLETYQFLNLLKDVEQILKRKRNIVDENDKTSDSLTDQLNKIQYQATKHQSELDQSDQENIIQNKFATIPLNNQNSLNQSESLSKSTLPIEAKYFFFSVALNTGNFLQRTSPCTKQKIEIKQNFIKKIINSILLMTSQMLLSEIALFQTVLFIIKDVYAQIAECKLKEQQLNFGVITTDFKNKIIQILGKFIEAIVNNDGLIDKESKEILTIDMCLVVMDCGIFTEFNDEFRRFTEDFFLMRQNKPATDVQRQKFYVKIANVYDDVNPDKFKKYSSKIRRVNIFIDQNIPNYQKLTEQALYKLSNKNTLYQGEKILCRILNYLIKKFHPKLKDHWMMAVAEGIDLGRIYIEDSQLELDQNDLVQAQISPIFKKQMIYFIIKYINMLGWFQNIHFFCKATLFAFNCLNSDTGNRLDEKSILLKTSQINCIYVSKAQQLLETLKKNSQTTQAILPQIKHKEEKILVQYIKKVNEVNRLLSTSQVQHYPSYYWIAKSEIIRSRSNKYYQLLYLDQLLMTSNYSESVSKNLTNNFRINFSLQKQTEISPNDWHQTDAFQPIELIWRKQCPICNIEYFPPYIYWYWLNLIIEFNQVLNSSNQASSNLSEFHNDNLKIPQIQFPLNQLSTSISFSSVDTYNRFSSYQKHIQSNFIVSIHLKEETFQYSAIMLQLFLEYSHFQLIHQHFNFWIQKISVTGIKKNINLLFNFCKLIQGVFGAVQSPDFKGSRLPFKKDDKLVHFIMFLITLQKTISLQKLPNQQKNQVFQPQKSQKMNSKFNSRNMISSRTLNQIEILKGAKCLSLQKLFFKMHVSLKALIVIAQQNQDFSTIKSYFYRRLIELKNLPINEINSRKNVTNHLFIRQYGISCFLRSQIGINYQNYLIFNIQRICSVYKQKFLLKQKIKDKSNKYNFKLNIRQKLKQFNKQRLNKLSKFTLSGIQKMVKGEDINKIPGKKKSVKLIQGIIDKKITKKVVNLINQDLAVTSINSNNQNQGTISITIQ